MQAPHEILLEICLVCQLAYNEVDMLKEGRQKI